MAKNKNGSNKSGDATEAPTYVGAHDPKHPYKKVDEVENTRVGNADFQHPHAPDIKEAVNPPGQENEQIIPLPDDGGQSGDQSGNTSEPKPEKEGGEDAEDVDDVKQLDSAEAAQPEKDERGKPKKEDNYLHVMARISKLVAQGKDSSRVYHNIREEMDLDKIGMSRSQVEKQAKEAEKAFAEYKLPVERRMWELKRLETELRADIVAELSAADLSDPGVVREVHRMVGDVIGSTGSPSLVEAIDLMDEMGIETAEYSNRLQALGFEELSGDGHTRVAAPVKDIGGGIVEQSNPPQQGGSNDPINV